MSTGALVQVNFVAPTERVELNGKLGVTAADVAASIGMDIKHVHEKLRRRKDGQSLYDRMRAKGLEVAIATVTNPGTYGDDIYETYVMDVEAAKFLVAKTNTDIAEDYILYLIRFETNARKAMTQITSQLDALQAFIDQHRVTNTKISLLESATKELTKVAEQTAEQLGDQCLTATQCAAIDNKAMEMLSNVPWEVKYKYKSKLLRRVKSNFLTTKYIGPDVTYRQIHSSKFPEVMKFLEQFDVNQLDDRTYGYNRRRGA